jgi:hypothetical protein
MKEWRRESMLGALTWMILPNVIARFYHMLGQQAVPSFKKINAQRYRLHRVPSMIAAASSARMKVSG